MSVQTRSEGFLRRLLLKAGLAVMSMSPAAAQIPAGSLAFGFGHPSLFSSLRTLTDSNGAAEIAQRGLTLYR